MIERALAAGCVPVAALVDIDDVPTARRRPRLPRLRRRRSDVRRVVTGLGYPHRIVALFERPARPTVAQVAAIGRPPRRPRSRRQPGQRRLDHPQRGGVRVGRPDPRSHQRRPARPAIAARGDGDGVRAPPRPDDVTSPTNCAPSTASRSWRLTPDADAVSIDDAGTAGTGGHPDRLGAGRAERRTARRSPPRCGSRWPAGSTR